MWSCCCSWTTLGRLLIVTSWFSSNNRRKSVIDEGFVACCKAKTMVQTTHRDRSGDSPDPWRTCSTAPHWGHNPPAALTEYSVWKTSLQLACISSTHVHEEVCSTNRHTSSIFTAVRGSFRKFNCTESTVFADGNCCQCYVKGTQFRVSHQYGVGWTAAGCSSAGGLPSAVCERGDCMYSLVVETKLIFASLTRSLERVHANLTLLLYK